MNNRDKNLSKKNKICRKIIEYGIIGLIVFSPLPAASVNEWSILVIQLWVLMMIGAYLGMKEKPRINGQLAPSLKWPRILFLLLFCFLIIQIVPLPKFLIKILSPHGFSFYERFSPGFLGAHFMSFSLIPGQSLQKGLEIISYFLLGFLIVKTVTERAQIMRLFYVIVGLGVFEAFYGMFELYNKHPRILFYKKIYNLDSVTGTFVNRNHLSGYLEMILPLAIGLIIARISVFSSGRMNWKEKLVRFSEKGLATNLLLSLGVIIMAIGIILSKSRSGVFILIFTFILFFELSILYFRKGGIQRKTAKNFLKVVFLIIIFISLYVGLEATLQRFALDKLLREGRPFYWSNTIGIFLNYPLFGTGLGTFPSLYPDLQRGEKIVRLYHAHNDYLEYLSELGLVGMLLLLGGIVLLIAYSFLSWKKRKHPEVKGLAMGGLVAIICILIHSITDFNLHIPANMVLFSVVISLTVVTAFYRKREDKGKQ